MTAFVRRLVVACIPIAAPAILFMLASLFTAHAQHFQTLVGSSSCRETGLGGAVQLANGGYIACGSSTFNGVSCGLPHAYVVKVDANGALVWDNVYSIGMVDSAIQIIEGANGDYLFCGSTQPIGSGVRDMFLIRIDTNGTVLNAITINMGGDEDAWDIYEATTGNLTTTYPGDVVMVGSTNAGTGAGAGRDAVAMRLSSTFAPIWMSQWGGPGSGDDYLLGVTEQTFGVPGGTTGDVIAVGGTNSSIPTLRGLNNGDILVLRLNGNTGTILLPPEGAAAWGYDQFDEGRSVRELQAATTPGDLVITGRTLSRMFPSINYEAFALQLQPDPTLPKRADLVFGDNNNGNDAGAAVREDPYFPGPPGGGIVIGGNTLLGGGPTILNQNAYLARFSANTLIPFPAVAFGGVGQDGAFALGVCTRTTAIETPGYILAGTCPSTNLVTPGNPSDHYLIKTDNVPAPTSSCNEADISFMTLGNVFVNQTLTFPISGVIWTPATPTVTAVSTATSSALCYKPAAHRQDNGGNDGVSGVNAGGTDLAGDAALAVVPNPASVGTELEIRFTMPAADRATVTVSDLSGHEIYRASAGYAAGAASHRVSTIAWPSGSYMVAVSHGTTRVSRRIVVTK
ncbi:MAG TPA: T9SS type A sorting domain-containing protein [Candidatus Kapabacteria bacterium]|nr:T9SS type A sorting domain-containing protein [Candidatus Kapabacteria bacterium]